MVDGGGSSYAGRCFSELDCYFGVSFFEFLCEGSMRVGT
jgi:hypothetical protein